jgi:hypothetical protein
VAAVEPPDVRETELLVHLFLDGRMARSPVSRTKVAWSASMLPGGILHPRQQQAPCSLPCTRIAPGFARTAHIA